MASGLQLRNDARSDRPCRDERRSEVGPRGRTRSPDPVCRPLGSDCLLVRWKDIAQHRSLALGLLFSGLILNDISVFEQNALLHAKDIGGDPIYRQTELAEAAMHDEPFALSKNDS